jgi:hypothetical protein
VNVKVNLDFNNIDISENMTIENVPSHKDSFIRPKTMKKDSSISIKSVRITVYREAGEESEDVGTNNEEGANMASLNKEQINLLENLAGNNIVESQSNYYKSVVSSHKQFHEDKSHASAVNNINIQIDTHRYASIEKDEISQIDNDSSNFIIDDISRDDNKSNISRPLSHFNVKKKNFKKTYQEEKTSPICLSDNEVAGKPKVSQSSTNISSNNIAKKPYSSVDVLNYRLVQREMDPQPDNVILELNEEPEIVEAEGVVQEVADFMVIDEDEASYYTKVLDYITGLFSKVKTISSHIKNKVYSYADAEQLYIIRDKLSYILSNVKSSTYIQLEYIKRLRDKITGILANNIPKSVVIKQRIGDTYSSLKNNAISGKEYFGQKMSNAYTVVSEKSRLSGTYIRQRMSDTYLGVKNNTFISNEKINNIYTGIKRKAFSSRENLTNKMGDIYTTVKNKARLSSSRLLQFKDNLKVMTFVSDPKALQKAAILGSCCIAIYITHQYLHYLKTIDYSFIVVYASMTLGIIIGYLLFQKLRDYNTRNHSIARLCYDDVKKILLDRYNHGELDPLIIQKEYITLQCQKYDISRYVFIKFIIPRIREMIKLDNSLIEATSRDMKHIWKLNNIIIV